MKYKIFFLLVAVALLMPIVLADPKEEASKAALDFMKMHGVFKIGNESVSGANFNQLSAINVNSKWYILVEVNKEGKKAVLLAQVFDNKVLTIFLVRQNLPFASREGLAL